MIPLVATGTEAYSVMHIVSPLSKGLAYHVMGVHLAIGSSAHLAGVTGAGLDEGRPRL